MSDLVASDWCEVLALLMPLSRQCFLFDIERIDVAQVFITDTKISRARVRLNECRPWKMRVDCLQTMRRAPKMG